MTHSVIKALYQSYTDRMCQLGKVSAMDLLTDMVELYRLAVLQKFKDIYSESINMSVNKRLEQKYAEE